MGVWFDHAISRSEGGGYSIEVMKGVWEGGGSSWWVVLGFFVGFGVVGGVGGVGGGMM